jgi:hypothetical protein
VASDIDAHRNIAEVTGGAVTLVEAGASPERLARAIANAAQADAPPADVRSWEEVGDMTLAVHERAAASGLPVPAGRA